MADDYESSTNDTTTDTSSDTSDVGTDTADSTATDDGLTDGDNTEDEVDLSVDDSDNLPDGDNSDYDDTETENTDLGDSNTVDSDDTADSTKNDDDLANSDNTENEVDLSVDDSDNLPDGDDLDYGNAETENTDLDDNETADSDDIVDSTENDDLTNGDNTEDEVELSVKNSDNLPDGDESDYGNTETEITDLDDSDTVDSDNTADSTTTDDSSDNVNYDQAIYDEQGNLRVLNNEQLLSLTPEQYNLYTDSLNSMSPEDRENFDSSFVQAEKDNYWKHVNNGDYERNSSIERDLDDIADGKYQGDDNIEGNVTRYTSMAGTWTLETAAHVDSNIKSNMVNQVGDFAEAYGPQIMNDMAQTAYVQYGVHTPTPIVHVDEYGNKTYDYGNESTTEFNDIGKIKTEYADDLMNRSEYPQTIDQNKIYNDWNKIPADQNEIMRENFGKSKNKLISQWEDENNISWPTYKENVYSSNGKLLRRAGDKYDGHHIQPLTFGGENTSTNLTPLHVLEHYDKQGIHATDSAFGKIENYYKEK